MSGTERFREGMCDNLPRCIARMPATAIRLKARLLGIRGLGPSEQIP